MDLIATTSLPQKGAAVANAQEFAVSSNGDRWLLETDAGSNPTMVVRQANPA
jgi:hypothetical protein